MQQRLNNFLLVIITLVFLLNPVRPSVSAAMDSSDPINLISSSDHGVEFTVSVPWQSLQHEVVDVDGDLYTRLDLPGWSNIGQQGAPMLPFSSQSIGAPFGAELTIEVIPGRSHKVELSAPVLPAATLLTQIDDFASGMDAVNLVHVIDPDPEIYAGSEIYPGQLAEITVDGRLRQQRLVGVGITPLQYDPAKNVLIVYESVHIKIRFDGQPGVMRSAVNPESSVYEDFFQSNLLNYAEAQAWRESPQPAERLQSESASQQNQLGAGALPWEPPTPGWRISVQEEGMYRLTYAELAAAGLPVVTLNPQTLQMFYQGEEIAIQVSGESDGVFDETDDIIFYGEAIDSKYTANNAYWLTYGRESGLRMEVRDSASIGTLATHYSNNVLLEENHIYRSDLPGDDAFERFYWDRIYAYPAPVTWSHNFFLEEPYDGAGSLQIALFGGLSNTAYNPDHHAIINLNGTTVADVKWDDLTWADDGFVEAEIPAGILQAGLNTLSVYLPLDTGATADFVLMDWAKIRYSSTFSVPSDEDQLIFSYETIEPSAFKVSGFSSESILAYDVSDPIEVAEINRNSLVIVADGPTYTMTFADEELAMKDYWVGTNSAITTLSSTRIIEDTPSNLGSTENRTDYILIAPPALWEQAERLAAHRADQGLVTALVDIQDIYDEFGYGVTDVSAIQAFLAFAYESWEPPAPAYVLLFGDGHYDPKNYLSTSPPSLIPPFLAMVDPWTGETAVDNRYVAFSGPKTNPQMMLGRLPANDIAEAEIMVSKIIAYEQDHSVDDWSMQVLAVAASADSGGNFALVSDNLIRDALPSPYQVEKVYFGSTHTDPAQARAALKNGINQGKLIVNFHGHGFTEGWSARSNPSEVFIRTKDIPDLSNQNKYPIFLAMTCNEGYFINPAVPAFGEAIVRAQDKGAIASWSPTGQGITSGHDFLNRGFFDAVFKHGADRLGQAVTSGLSRLWNSGGSGLYYMLDTYILFGDPALMITRNPAAVDDFYTTAEDFKLEVSPLNGVLKNDSGFAPGNPLTAMLVTDVANGALIFAPDGSFTYTPDKDWFGVEQFTYRVDDNGIYIGTATVTITVVAINDPPVAYPQTIETPMETPVEIVLTGSDVDGDPLTYSFEQPAHGDLYQNLPPGSGPRQGQALEPPLTYAPHPGYFGSDSFEYVVNDGKVNSAPTTISITIIGDSGTNLIFLPLIMH